MLGACDISLSEQSRMTQIAITRAVSRAMERCELTHLERREIDIELARIQHGAYEQALRDAGCEVRQLAEEPELPDSVFVEDTVIALDEVAVLTCPGAESRRAEIDSMAQALTSFRKLLRIEAPGTLDGGDVLRLDRVVHVGVSSRSNTEGIGQLRHLLAPFDYRVEAVPLQDCLHLKSAATQIAPDLLLVNPDWVDTQNFPGYRTMPVHPDEPSAANAVLLGERLLYSASFPRTAELLRQADIDVYPVDMSEAEKAEGAMTCCSVIISA